MSLAEGTVPPDAKALPCKNIAASQIIGFSSSSLVHRNDTFQKYRHVPEILSFNPTWYKPAQATQLNLAELTS